MNRLFDQRPGNDSIAEYLAGGEARVAMGDPRGAVAFYQAALREVGRRASTPPALIDRLRNAQSFVQRAMVEFEQALDGAAGERDLPDPIAATRLCHALDMVRGNRAPYPQQPSLFYYPYLPPRQFFERGEFEWVPDLEASAPAIRAELEAVLADGDGFNPYVENHPDRPVRDFHGLNNDPSWTALYLWKHGRPVDKNLRRCPATVAAIGGVPLATIGRRTPSVFFSRLEPGAHIPPHTGMLNTRLICHLPLIVPDGCWLRVGNETREWREGELTIFDDSIEHEARNSSNRTRIVLIFDIWRPELTAEERQGVSRIFDAIDDFRPIQMD